MPVQRYNGTVRLQPLSQKGFRRTATRTTVCAWWDTPEKKGTWVKGPQKKFFEKKIKMPGKLYNRRAINECMGLVLDIGRLHSVSVSTGNENTEVGNVLFNR